jgi:nucleotide-binding universal stress UspA family protein
MRRILVPLNGSAFAESILPDALRLAAPDGELVLVRDASKPEIDDVTGKFSESAAVDHAEDYLENLARKLHSEGVAVRAQTMVMGNPSDAIDEAIRLVKPDVVACATHGRTPLQRLLWGGVVWKALTHSSVPVLLRHPYRPGEQPAPFPEPMLRRVMVPLDGSELAEKALPLAQQLATDGHGSVHLVRVTYEQPQDKLMPPDPSRLGQEVENYVNDIAQNWLGEVETHVMVGPVVDSLVRAVGEWDITDVVMASHGRSGLSRVILGSVADALIHRLHCPVIVVPALAASTQGFAPVGRKPESGAAMRGYP